MFALIFPVSCSLRLPYELAESFPLPLRPTPLLPFLSTFQDYYVFRTMILENKQKILKLT